MSVTVHGIHMSEPTRNVLMTLEILKVPYDLKPTSPLTGQTRTPEFLKLNPQHNIPVLVDGDFVLNESRAIMTYVASKFGADSKLYPTDLKTRAHIDQRLYFEMGSLFKSGWECVLPVVFRNEKPTESQVSSMKENFGWFNDFLKPTGFVAGTDHITLADIAFLSTYSTMAPMGIIDLSPYKEIPAWFERMKKAVPKYDEVNGVGANQFVEWYKAEYAKIGN